MVENLIGVWNLVSFNDVDDSGTHRAGPLGPEPRGMLVYTADGHVSVGMMATTHGAEASYMGYAGRWYVRDGQLVHRIEICSRADWVGIEQTREADLRDDELMIHATREVNGMLRRRTLHWRKVSAGQQ